VQLPAAPPTPADDHLDGNRRTPREQ
jgi:hypothetical protein